VKRSVKHLGAAEVDDLLAPMTLPLPPARGPIQMADELLCAPRMIM
jgi:hypothetical protein